MMSHPDAKLIKNVWPDKTLYGGIMLQITGLLGILQGFIFLATSVAVSPNVPELLRTYPPVATILLSAIASGLGYLAVRDLKPLWGMAGAVAGVLSLGFFGVGSLLSVIAFGFLLWAMKEREDLNAATRKLTADEWPDKSLAASLTSFVGGVVTLAWGALLLTRTVNFGGDLAGVIGLMDVGAGVLGLAAAHRMYRQRGAMMGVVAAVACIVGLGAFVVGPILGLATLALINEASKEREFDPAPPRVAPARA